MHAGRSTGGMATLPAPERSARPVVAVPATALALVLLSLLGWSLLAGGVCGSSGAKAATYLAAYAAPALLAGLLGRLVLRAGWGATAAGVAAGLLAAFLVYLGVVFPLCG